MFIWIHLILDLAQADGLTHFLRAVPVSQIISFQLITSIAEYLSFFRSDNMVARNSGSEKLVIWSDSLQMGTESGILFLFLILKYIIHTASYAAPKNTLCQSMLESNPRLFQRYHWQLDYLSTQLDLIHHLARSHPQLG